MAKGYKFGENVNRNPCDGQTFDCNDTPDEEEIRRALKKSVHEALTKDWDLVALGCHEQAITHRIAVYLEHRLPDFNTDCEYNRREHDVKRYLNSDGERKGMRPDIVVHRRNSSVNLLAVEIKANNNPDSPNDPQKLKALATLPEYSYRVSAFVRIFNSVSDISSGSLRAAIQWYEVSDGGIEARPEEYELSIDDIAPKVLEIYDARTSQS